MAHVFGASASFAVVALLVVVAFGALVIIHELGHFAAARLCRMRVERFSVGFGPVLLRRRQGETEWALSAVPFGGYVKIAGMGPGEEIAPDDRAAYANQPAWRRFLVILAGPAMNYLFAVLLAAAMLASLGFREPDPAPVIGEIVAGGAAARAGLQAGDRVRSVDGRSIETWKALVEEVVAHPGREARLSVERGGATVELVATPEDKGGAGRLGIGQAARVTRASPAEAVAGGLRVTNERAGEILAGLGQMVTGRQRAELRGPVGIAQEMAKSARAGAAPFISIVWFISIALGLFNLLPLPALDGGRLVFLVYEIVTRRRVNQRVENVVHLAGFVALFGLLLAVTVFGDLARIFR
ncbi:RIP metalloprotease RseP [Anaeromyxobacter diazotrophicus]|uniref:Zinc metalloprotease n=1 Tax=Anaeromyxobacter diazotrophicus TaxID=2590199 RepID=A0A7I9VSK7_9BACT|nr:RIP metalloprotease RseP [Anaeromyxobacter diazotrophicus]GEJ59432.1 RIP metalloprotease RseP [Anaeromyxobacter diazotrophicus]